MSKSVLVIDTPENFGKCKFISEFWCRAMGCRRVPNNDVIPGWCPLKPLPEKSTTENDMTDYQCGMVDGRLGKSVFLTREEADNKFEEMKNGK